MASLKNIKLKIHSYKKTGTVTRAMEAVSAVKMRKSQERALSGRAYAAAALTILEKLAGTQTVIDMPLMQDRKGKSCFIVVTSDKGLAGSLNSGVIRRVEREIADRALDKKDVVIIGFGRRGADYFASRGYDVRIRHENVSDSIGESDIREVVDGIFAWHTAKEIGSVLVGYQNFLSTFEQEPTIRHIVPITREVMRVMVAGIRPARGRYSPSVASAKEGASVAYTIEPDPEKILAELLPKLLNIAVFHALLEAKASEHSARMVAMKNATDKAKEMVRLSTRIYNKVRQAAITREVSEIVGGIEAMR